MTSRLVALVAFTNTLSLMEERRQNVLKFLYCIIMFSVSALFNTLYMYRTSVHCSVHIALYCTVLYSVVQYCLY